jgi:hypothetical protein
MDLVGKPHHEQEAATEAWNLASDEGGGGASLFCNREELGAWKRGMNCKCGNGEEGQGGGVPFIGPIEGAKAVAVADNGASMHRQFWEVGRRVGAVLWSKWGGEEVWQSFLRRGEDGVWWPATVVIGGGVAR